MDVKKDVSNLNKVIYLLVLLGLVLPACAPSPSMVQTAIANTLAVATEITTTTLIPSPTPTQWAWKVIKNIFTIEQQNDSDIWRVLPLANDLEILDAFEMKLDMESVGANVIVLEGTKNSISITCEGGTLGVFLKNDIVVGLAFDNNDNRPEMPIINETTICQITVIFNQYAKHIEFFQNDLLIFQLIPEEVGDFPGGLFPDGKIREVDLTSGPRSGNARLESGHIISKVKLNELVFYAPTAVMSVVPDDNTPEPTPTNKVKQFEICSIEDWKNCYIPIDELGKNGDYFRWVSESWNPQLAVPDPNIVAIFQNGGALIFQVPGGGKIPAANKWFTTGFSYGWTDCGVTWGGESHPMTCAVVPIAFAVPGRPGETKKLIALYEQAYDQTDSIVATELKPLEKGEKMMLGGFAYDSNMRVDQIDFANNTIKYYPDIFKRLESFQKTLDPSYISEPGIVAVVYP